MGRPCIERSGCTDFRAFHAFTLDPLKMPSVFRASSRAVLVAAAVVLASCNIERTVALTVGEDLSIGEQVAIEAAYGKAARVLKDTPIDLDSVLAELGTVAARLVRLQGRASTFDVSNGATTVTMKGVAVRSDDAELGGTIEILLAWEGLDVEAFTVDRVLLIQRGAGTPSAFVQVEMPSGTITRGSGTFNLSEGSFRRECAGFSSGCTVGSLTAQSDLDASAPATLVGEFPSQPIVAYHVIVD